MKLYMDRHHDQGIPGFILYHSCEELSALGIIMRSC
jgi:hypothetical protein